jgi:hypothetical protein
MSSDKSNWHVTHELNWPCAKSRLDSRRMSHICETVFHGIKFAQRPQLAPA